MKTHLPPVHHMQARTAPPLHYLQPSPVRGQLEPLDELTKKSGCRFIQCTETPDELKVLLPPRTAQIYAILLKEELAELEKQHDASWDRILDIRRLKDRMIRKCQRLAKIYNASNPEVRTSFLTLHAPPDFRVKEIEKWIRHRHGSDALKKTVPPDTLRQRGSFCCDRCANLVPHHHTISSARRPPIQPAHSRRSSVSEMMPPKGAILSRRPSVSMNTTKALPRPPSPHRSAVAIEETIERSSDLEIRAEEHRSLHASNYYQENVTSRTASGVESSQVFASNHQEDASVETSKFTAESKIQESRRSMHTIVENAHELRMEQGNRSRVETLSETESLARLSIDSPDPIPVPYHGSTSAAFMEICDSPVDAMRSMDTIRSETSRLRRRESSAEDSGPSPPSEDEPAMDGMSRPYLPRRSSLKRSNSELRMSMAYSAKTVSWAMDRDWTHQMTKYHAAAAQVENAEQEWNVIYKSYQEDLAGLKALRRNVSQALSELRAETDRLQHEDEVIRHQEEKLRQGYEQLEQKHGQYRAKVKAVLQETEQVLTLCGTKRDGGL